MSVTYIDAIHDAQKDLLAETRTSSCTDRT